MRPNTVLGELQSEGLLIIDIFLFREVVGAALWYAEEEDVSVHLVQCRV